MRWRCARALPAPRKPSNASRKPLPWVTDGATQPSAAVVWGRRLRCFGQRLLELVRDFLVGHLRDAGWRVLEANNAEQAIAMLKAGQQIDIVITDIQLKGAQMWIISNRHWH